MTKYFYSILSTLAGLLIFLTKGNAGLALTILAIYLVVVGIWMATDKK